MLVTLVGAGPGDPSLLTLGAKQALETCDAVVYDALANRDFLQYVPENAEKIYVGKIADQHALKQGEINLLLVAKAKANGGQKVVRLKGGDPYIFGRGGEEALFLREADVPFKVIPGISSAIAAPAYAGIPLTHRSYTSSLTILTGHENPDKPESAINWNALVKSGSTIVFVMGMKNLPKIVKKLLLAGMEPEMPAAVIQQGTTPFQKSVYAPLVSLPDKVAEAGLEHPAIIVVGKVVQLAGLLDWYGHKPLLGKTIVVTRAREQSSQISEKLSSLGACVLQCPSIKIEPMPDYSQLDAAIQELPFYAWIIFTSVNGVKYFWKRLRHAGLDARALAACKVAAIGPATATALLEKGIAPDLLPKSYVAEDLARGLIAASGQELANARILLPRAASARMILPDMLARAGAMVDVAPAYITAPDGESGLEARDLLKNNEVDCITFASSSTVRNFLNLVPASLLLQNRRVKLAAIGPITCQTLMENGLKADIVPEKYTIPALIDAICGYFAHYGDN